MKKIEITAIRPLAPVSHNPRGHEARVDRSTHVSKQWIGDYQKPRAAFNALKANRSGIYEAIIYRDMEMEKPEYIKVELQTGYLDSHIISGSNEQAVDAVIRMFNAS